MDLAEFVSNGGQKAVADVISVVREWEWLGEADTT